MSFEDLQKTWQSHNPGATVTLDADLLLKEVRRNQHHFWSMIFWRDAREVGVCFLMALFFVYCAARTHDWTPYLIVLACCAVGGFMIVDRVLERRKQPVMNEALKDCIESSLRQVNHQIWLLRNVLWWYLSPFAAGLGISGAIAMWRARHAGLAVTSLAVYLLVLAVIYWGIYQLNQYAVRKTLEPRRQELQDLVAGLEQN